MPNTSPVATSPLTGVPAPHFPNALADEIAAALRRTGYLELFDVDVDVEGKNVSLRGRVPSYYLKQKAEYITRSLPGVGTLTSKLEVTTN